MSRGWVVGYDLSLTAAGVAAVAHPDIAGTPNRPQLATVGTKPDRFPPGFGGRNARVEAQAELVLRATPNQVRLAVFEELPMARPGQSGLYQERCALLHMVAAYLRRNGIPVVEVMPTTLKAWATGRGNADKWEVVDAMSELWPHAAIGRDDNRADALSLATMGAQHLGWYEPELVHHWAPKVDWGPAA